MTKAMIWLVLLGTLIGCAAPKNHNWVPRLGLGKAHQVELGLFERDRRPSQELLSLLNLFHMGHQSTWEGVIQETQKAWLRKNGIERFMMQESYGVLRPQILEHLCGLGFSNALVPKDKSYDYAVFLGGSLENTMSRVDFLLEQMALGVQFPRLVFLVSKRPLDERAEVQPFNKAYGKPLTVTTETALTKALFEREARGRLRAGLEIRYVDTPMQVQKGGGLRRPNTLDTVVEWLKEKPQPGRVLVFSNQPYIFRQNLVVQNALGKPWTVETVGPKADSALVTDVYLDELARAIFESNSRRPFG